MFKWDVYVRLRYAHINPKKIVLIDDMQNLISTVKEQSCGKIFTMVCFDMTSIIKNLVKEYENANH